MKKKSQSLKYEEAIKKPEEPIKLEKGDMLNLDSLYECISPPSELNGETRVNAKFSKGKNIFLNFSLFSSISSFDSEKAQTCQNQTRSFL